MHQRKQARRRDHYSTPALTSSNHAAAAGTDKSSQALNRPRNRVAPDNNKHAPILWRLWKMEPRSPNGTKPRLGRLRVHLVAYAAIFRPMISRNAIFTEFRVLRFSWNAIWCYIGFLRGFYLQHHIFSLKSISNCYACYPAQLFVAVQIGIPGTIPWHLFQGMTCCTHVSSVETISHG